MLSLVITCYNHRLHLSVDALDESPGPSPRYAAVRVKALEGRPHQIFMDLDTRGHHGSQELAILHFLPGRCFGFFLALLNMVRG